MCDKIGHHYECHKIRHHQATCVSDSDGTVWQNQTPLRVTVCDKIRHHYVPQCVTKLDISYTSTCEIRVWCHRTRVIQLDTTCINIWGTDSASLDNRGLEGDWDYDSRECQQYLSHYLQLLLVLFTNPHITCKQITTKRFCMFPRTIRRTTSPLQRCFKQTLQQNQRLIAFYLVALI